jgi:hypothetical protein
MSWGHSNVWAFELFGISRWKIFWKHWRVSSALNQWFCLTFSHLSDWFHGLSKWTKSYSNNRIGIIIGWLFLSPISNSNPSLDTEVMRPQIFIQLPFWRGENLNHAINAIRKIIPSRTTPHSETDGFDPSKPGIGKTDTVSFSVWTNSVSLKSVVPFWKKSGTENCDEKKCAVASQKRWD